MLTLPLIFLTAVDKEKQKDTMKNAKKSQIKETWTRAKVMNTTLKYKTSSSNISHN